MKSLHDWRNPAGNLFAAKTKTCVACDHTQHHEVEVVPAIHGSTATGGGGGDLFKASGELSSGGIKNKDVCVGNPLPGWDETQHACWCDFSITFLFSFSFIFVLPFPF
jgi:hypothetical protein